MSSRVGAAFFGAAVLVACGGGSVDVGPASGSSSGSAVASTGSAGAAAASTGAASTGAASAGSTGPMGSSGSAKLAARLRNKGNFLIGMGNDLATNHNMDGAYTVGPTLDLHAPTWSACPPKAGGPTGTPMGRS